MVWRCFPAHEGTAVIAIPLDEAERIVARGWITVRGERATVTKRMADEPYNAILRVLFDRKFPYPHP